LLDWGLIPSVQLAGNLIGGIGMRVLSLVISFLLVVSLATMTLFYLEQRVGQNRIQVQDEWLSSSDQAAGSAGYQAYGP